MDSIFGLSMWWILAVTSAFFLLCVVLVIFIALTNRVIFRMALRNIPRRKAQTVLIMCGLMLSTLIIAASLTTGDTLDYSLTKSSYDGLGQTDETIAFVGNTDSDGEVATTNVPIDARIADDLRALLADDPDVDAVMAMLTVSVPAVNVVGELSEPSVTLTGIDGSQIDAFGGLTAPNGDSIDFNSATDASRAFPVPQSIVDEVNQRGILGPDGTAIDLTGVIVQPAIISESLADEVDARIDDSLVLFFDNKPYPVVVTAIAKDSILTGFATGIDSVNMMGVAIPLAQVQELTGLQGQARFIAVSNTGGVQSGMRRTDNASDALKGALATIEGGDQLGVNPIKADAVKGAETVGNVFMSLFIVLGLFSAFAGILLIFLIFTMLAAERRAEMGMARAVGMKRMHLVQSFLSEGTIYALGAALIGAIAGVGVAYVMALVMGQIIGDLFEITPHFSLRSLAVAYTLGVAVTFVTIVFASVRASRVNIVAAIRDLPDEATPSARSRPRWGWWNRLPRVAGKLTAVLMFPLEAIWNILLIPVKLIVWIVRLVAYAIGWGPIAVALGAVLVLLGTTNKSVFFFSVGLTLLSVGGSLIFGKYIPKRIAYSFFSILMLTYWMLPYDWQSAILPDLGTGGFEMFFVSGLSMVAFSTLLIMWNAEIIIAVFSAVGRLSSRWLPAIKTAVAYPLAARGRTGLTVAMFAMVIFSLVTLTTINANFISLFTTDEADAGYDISVITNPSNPVNASQLISSLEANNVDTSQIAGIGEIYGITFDNSQVRNPGTEEWKRYPISAMDESFMQNGEIPLQARDPQYADDAAVFAALQSGEPVAIVDAFALADDSFGDPSIYYAPSEADMVDGVLTPFSIEVQSPTTGEMMQVKVIGVVDQKVSMFFGLYLSTETFNSVFPSYSFSTLFVRLQDHGGDAAVSEAYAKQIESSLLTSGAQADSIIALIEEQQSFFTGFFRLLQGFMGLGLFVGIAALGVVSFRSVVERRQQIGMLRAIGYRRNMVALSFLLESVVVAMLGVVSGMVLALVLSYNLINSEDFTDGAEITNFVIPWSTVIIFLVLSLVSAALMTWFPAKRAASVPIAEALRYE